MTLRFAHESLAQRVVFAAGEAATSLASEVERLGSRRVVVIAGPAESALADEVTAGLPVDARVDDVAMHVPIEVANRARAVAESAGADTIVSVGGGSTTGLAKAVALTTGIPIVAVPTTYAGSEATNVWGLTEGGRKTTGVDPRVLPRSIVYDAALTTSLPVGLSTASGLNAVAHCVDSMWAPRSDPINRAMAVEGIRALRRGLPAIVSDPTGLDGRERALYGAYLSAVAFASAGSGLHHKICHVLGGMFDLPHAETHAVVLPHVLALNVAGAPEAEELLTAALGGSSALDGLEQLRTSLGAPNSLAELGMPESGIPAAVDAILAVAPVDNPVPVTPENLTRLLQRAWGGRDPQ